MNPFPARSLSSSCLVALLVCAPAAHATVVGIFGGSSTGAFPVRAASLGYATEFWWLPAQITPPSLANVDVLYVTSGNTAKLSNEAATIVSWVSQGNGLIVEQPNVTGLVAILPPSLPISIWSKDYDGTNVGPDPVRNVLITPAGALHPITAGLAGSEICQNLERVLHSDVAPGYDILGVQASNTNYVAVAAATCGLGRVVFHTGNAGTNSFSPGSDTYIQQMLDWAAVPEPHAALALAAAGILSARRRTSA
ncbi:hypothetical protein GX586_10910 [bacterium]|nr:hypothetical protein [bacterium]